MKCGRITKDSLEMIEYGRNKTGLFVCFWNVEMTRHTDVIVMRRLLDTDWLRTGLSVGLSITPSLYTHNECIYTSISTINVGFLVVVCVSTLCFSLKTLVGCLNSSAKPPGLDWEWKKDVEQVDKTDITSLVVLFGFLFLCSFDFPRLFEKIRRLRTRVPTANISR